MKTLRPLTGALTLAVAASVGAACLAQQSARILVPTADQTVRSNSGRLKVVVVGVPRGSRLLAYLDGRAVKSRFEPPTFELQGVDRGTHVLEVALIDRRDRELGRLGPVTFHMHQASRLFGSLAP